MSHHLVVARGLSYSYPDGTPALEGVSFRITHGESVAVIGANGAGKSSLLMQLNGCLLPVSGVVEIGDLPVNSATLKSIRQTVGMVFQNPDHQLFMPSVREDVAFGPANMGLDGDALDRQVQRALNQVGCSHLADKPPYRLSGGEKKRVAIATVLAMSPDILVIDEPTGGIDPRGRRQIMELLKGFQHTKIITSHDLDMVLEVCERVLLLHEGRLVADGSAKELLENRSLLEQCGLELPLSMQGCGAKSFA